MSLAFWRRTKKSPDASASAAQERPKRSQSSSDDDGSRADEAATLRARARRRLIGAAALLLVVVIVVPMVLDPEPRTVPDNIPIDIPSEKSKFSPRLALPPVPAPESVPLAPPADAPPPTAVQGKPDAAATAGAESRPAAATAGAESRPAAATAGAESRPAAAAAVPKGEEQRAQAALEGRPVEPRAVEPKPTEPKPADAKATDAKSSTVKAGEKLPAPTKGGKFAVQAAATSTEAAARELADRLRKAGLPPYTERVETAEGMRYRVRVGPYASREDAERVRARLKSLGLSANVVGA
jgi:DedD protein